MAVDRALLDQAVETGGGPTLRLYWWDPRSLSLGANQAAVDSIDWVKLAADGYGVVRRPTGGRAILHAEELTYSVVAPSPPGGITAAYLWIAEGLRGGLAEAGIEVDLERTQAPVARGHDPGGEHPALEVRQPCFSTAGRYELVSGGYKIVGSAQCRSQGWFMQHGSILLGGEHANLPRYLIGSEAEKEVVRLRRATVDCATLLGRPIAADDLAPVFAAGFARALGITLEAGELSREELQRAERLRSGQFSTREWTRFGRREEAPDTGDDDRSSI
jgi:lipoate-protein ligase A